MGVKLRQVSIVGEGGRQVVCRAVDVSAGFKRKGRGAFSSLF